MMVMSFKMSVPLGLYWPK